MTKSYEGICEVKSIAHLVDEAIFHLVTIIESQSSDGRDIYMWIIGNLNSKCWKNTNNIKMTDKTHRGIDNKKSSKYKFLNFKSISVYSRNLNFLKFQFPFSSIFYFNSQDMEILNQPWRKFIYLNFFYVFNPHLSPSLFLCLCLCIFCEMSTWIKTKFEYPALLRFCCCRGQKSDKICSEFFGLIYEIVQENSRGNLE